MLYNVLKFVASVIYGIVLAHLLDYAIDRYWLWQDQKQWEKDLRDLRTHLNLAS